MVTRRPEYEPDDYRTDPFGEEFEVSPITWIQYWTEASE